MLKSIKINNRKYNGWIIIVLVVLFASCKVSQQWRRPDNLVKNNLYRSADSTDTATIAMMPWRQLFTDTLLQGLIQEGIDKNFDLQIACARIKQAQANFQQSKQAFFPTLGANASATLQKPASNSVASSHIYELYGSSSWEADIWGKLRSAKRAALASLLQSEAYKRAVQTQLVADIASNYYALIAYDEQLKTTQQTVQNRIKDVETMKTLKEGDVVTGAAVVQSAANRFAAEVTIPDLKQNIRQTENTICVLLGREPGSIIRDSLFNQQVYTDLKTGIPAQLLANRPDVQEAEYQLRYYFELTNTARAYFYPALTITASGGITASDVGQLFNASSVFGNIIGGLTQPIFNQGLNRQRLKISQAQQEEYLAAYKKIILTAGQEISDALYSYQAAVDKMGIRSQQIAYLEKAVDYTNQLMRYTSSTNYTDVLTSEQSLLSAQLNSISDKLQQLQAVVTLYSSLGGGWR